MQSFKSLSNGRQVALIVHSPAQLCQRYCGHKSNKCKVKQEMASKRCLTDHQFTSTSPVPSSGRISVLCFLFCWSCNWVASNFSLLCLAVKGKKTSYEKDKSASTACFFGTAESVWWREQGDETIVHMKYQCSLDCKWRKCRQGQTNLELNLQQNWYSAHCHDLPKAPWRNTFPRPTCSPSSLQPEKNCLNIGVSPPSTTRVTCVQLG